MWPNPLIYNILLDRFAREECEQTTQQGANGSHETYLRGLQYKFVRGRGRAGQGPRGEFARPVSDGRVAESLLRTEYQAPLRWPATAARERGASYRGRRGAHHVLRRFTVGHMEQKTISVDDQIFLLQLQQVLRSFGKSSSRNIFDFPPVIVRPHVKPFPFFSLGIRFPPRSAPLR